MRTTLDLARMELQKMFYSPIAWLVLILFAVQSSIFFIGSISDYIRFIEVGNTYTAITSRLFAGPLGLFTRLQPLVFLYFPLITMGLMSKEFGSGSIKLLYSSPISNTQIVLGKYLSVLVFSLCLIGILFIESIFGFIAIKDFDFPLVLTGLMGLFLLFATYSAIGLFMSSLTSYQIVAAIASFATFFALDKVGDVWQTIDFVRDITYWLSISNRANTFVRGLICSEDLLYFILVSGLFIVFTIFRLKGIREKSAKYISFMKYVGAFLIVVIIGYITTIPSLMKYYDSSSTKFNTLTENSQEVITKLKGKIKITTYVNLFHNRTCFWALPKQRKEDEERYEQYRRFYPNIDMEWKYYYAVPVEEFVADLFHKNNKGKTEEEVLKNYVNSFNMDLDKVKPASFYKNEIDLESELNRLVRKIETEDGRVAHLRLFNDMQILPSEAQKTAAFKSLVEDLPVVAFVSGHGERSINNVGTRGYNSISIDKPFRWSLINNGFDIAECNLSKPVDSKINIMVIADVRASFSKEELKNLDDYIDRGGNLIIAADHKRQENMNPLVERFGVKFQPGQIVEYNRGYGMDLITSNMTEKGKDLVYQFDEYIFQNEKCITMPGAIAIAYGETLEFNYTPVLLSDSIINIPNISDSEQLAKLKKDYANIEKEEDPIAVAMRKIRTNYEAPVGLEESDEKIQYKGSWNELKTTDFVDDIAMYNPKQGELGGPVTTALALTRKVGEKEQRIMILGDADCLSNGEIIPNRKGINAANFSFVTGLFYWLTYEESPIDVRRPHAPDDNMLLKKDDLGIYKILYRIVFPAILIACILLIWLRRKGR